MKVYELRDLARLLLQLADEMEAAGVTQHTELHAEPVRRVNGGIAVTLPGPDLFSEIERDALGNCVRESPPMPVIPKTRTYSRVSIPMQDGMNVPLSKRVRKAQGFCARNDIERSIARTTGRSREDVREAVNRIAERMQITCVKSRSYRYYPRSLRAKIINEAVELLKAS